MRSKLFVVCSLGFIVAGNAFGAVVLEKRSRQMPFVEVFECQGIHSFIFRGPTGTSREPILVPPREYWTAREAGIYSFVVRYHSGKVCSRLVTPEVFARYRVGDDFYDRAAVSSDSYESSDSKSVQPVTQQRTARARHQRKPSTHRVAKQKRKQSSPRTAKHKRKHRSQRIAAR